MGEGLFTVFAPTNDAFAALFLQEHVLDYLGSNPDELKKVLLYYVIGDFLLVGDLKEGTLTSLDGGSVYIELDPPMVKQANIISINSVASNSVMHSIDSVLIPPSILLPVCPDICCCECYGECTGKGARLYGL